MSYSLSAAAIPAVEMQLNALSNILDKAIAYCEAKKVDQTVVLGLRLTPDMFPFSRQVQIVTGQARNLARLAGGEPTKIENTEANLADLKARVSKSLEVVKGLDRNAIDGAADKDITFPMGPTKKATMKGADYLRHFVLPNFYFHMTTAYALLRQAGVDNGKMDFLGQVPMTMS